MDNPGGVRNIGWRVTFAGMGVNLALGVLYSWSVIKKEIPATWDWTDFEKTLPYSIACLVFSIAMVPAGRAQDRYGPRWVALIGGLTVGLGMILASFTTTVIGFIVGFGGLTGIGIGMGYAAATPAAVKWFPPQRTGLIAGLVVAGFGLASVYIAPLAKWLIDSRSVAMPAGGVDSGPGVQFALLVLGIAFLVIVSILSQFLRVPPAGWKPEAPASAVKAAPKPVVDFTWPQMLKTPTFYLLWIMYAFAAGAGLMIIASMAPIIKLQAGPEASKNAFLFVALLAVGNACGRIASGWLSDRIGRKATFGIVFLFQAGLMFAMSSVTSVALFIPVAILIGANYGANLALFPSITKDYFGLKNFGVNYGWVFTAWGVGGFVLSQISGKVYDTSRLTHAAALQGAGKTVEDVSKLAVGNYTLAYFIAGGCLVVAFVLLLMTRSPASPAAPVPSTEPGKV